jgi:prepilin-type processing-associated H-X9-DG protein
MTVPCKRCGQMVQVPYQNPGMGAAKGAGIGMILLVVGLISFVVLIGCGGVLVALLLPAVESARGAARRVQSSNNLKQIMLAMHNYHDTHGEFPPAYIADADGKPMHSWRVLILPYIEQQSLYNSYDFSQPWDSPENLAIAQFIPPVYRSPGDSSPNAQQTNYVMFVGPGTTNTGQGKSSMSDIKDGTSNTLCIIETASSGIDWTQPRDLDAAQLDFLIRNMHQPAAGQINAVFPGGVNAGFFDGSVRFMPDTTPPALMRDLVNPADGKVVTW